MLEQQYASTGTDSRQPPSPRTNSSEVVHRPPSTSQQGAGSSSYKALQISDSVSKPELHKRCALHGIGRSDGSNMVSSPQACHPDLSLSLKLAYHHM
jgi:hypothetical protein